MLEALGIILAVIVAVAILLVIYAATRPNTFRIERRISVNAPPERIHPLIEDFHRWSVWSPWEKMEPNVEKTFSGADRGVGSVYEWKGNKTGQGRMEMLEASTSRLLIKLDFLKPFKASNMAEFLLVPRAGQTELTWAMFGPNLFVGKIMSIFMNMDRMIGKDFEKGLIDIKAAAESA